MKDFFIKMYDIIFILKVHINYISNMEATIELSRVLVIYGLTKSFVRKSVKCGVLRVKSGSKKIKNLNITFEAVDIHQVGEKLRVYHKGNKNFSCDELLKALDKS